ncbi:MAG: hypothetical protein HYR85_20925 [Planctomycetes bacterium]|nr:hypothetical protein [Planctomycetota bacterium]MBI3844901.1 hypothetical protein [Planctomycetota bacterium]
MIHGLLVLCLAAAPMGDTPTEPPVDHSKPNFTMPELFAISRADNDWRSYADEDSSRLPIPDDVGAVLRAFVAAKYGEYVDNYELHGDYYRRLDEFYRGTFVVMGPCGLDVYAMNFEGDCGWSTAYFFAHDTTTGVITREPVEICTKWMDANSGGLVDLLQTPLVSLDDVDSDGRSELVVEAQVHNGTLCNAAIYTYFHIARDGALMQILAVETCSVDPFDEDVRLVRTVIALGRDRIQLLVDAERDGARESRSRIGDVLLTTTGAPRPFRVQARRAFVEEFERVPTEDLLITVFGGGDDAFLAGR